MDERPRFPDESQPADYKTACDGRGGLVRVRFVGGPHAGRSLFIDEHDLPDVIYTSGEGRPFEWWTERNQAAMMAGPMGQDRAAPPVRHELRILDETREPQFVASVATTT